MEQQSAGKMVAQFVNEQARVAADTEDMADLLSEASEGDNLRVRYLDTNGRSLNSHGEITKLSEQFGDIWFATDEYLHFNADTGDYFFQDGRRKSPEDGYAVTSVTLYQTNPQDV